MNFGVDFIYENNNKWNEDSALLLFFYGSSTYYMMAAGWFLMGYKHEPWDQLYGNHIFKFRRKPNFKSIKSEMVLGFHDQTYAIEKNSGNE